MPKSPEAFRTISEVADWLGVQAHVLRFWESKFAQVKPIKRAGGRRYYRPADMLLLGGIKKLLHDDGLTIKGAQKLLREKGVAFVADQSQALDDLTIAVIEGDAGAVGTDTEEAAVALDGPEADDQAPDVEAPDPVQPTQPAATSDATEDVEDLAIDDIAQPEEDSAFEHAPTETTSQPSVEASPAPSEPMSDPQSAEPSVSGEEEGSGEGSPAPMPSFRARPRSPGGSKEEAPVEAPGVEDVETANEADEADVRPEADTTERRPRVVDVPPVPPASELSANPSALSALARIRRMTPEHAREIKPLLARLTRLRASMGNPRKDTHKD
jgi:DNA-binding transcriptional MerR regulator